MRKLSEQMHKFSDEIRLEGSIVRHKLSDRAILIGLIKFVVIIAAIFILSNLIAYFYTNTDELLSIIVLAKGFGPLIIILLIILEVVIAPLPGFVVAVAAGYVYGAWLGALYSYIGNVLGSLIAFSLAKKYGRPFVEKIITYRLINRYDRFFHKVNHYLMVFYMVPILPVDIISFVAGLSKMSFKKFFIVITLGFIPNVILLTSFGGYLGDLDVLTTIFFVLIFFVAVGLLAWLFKWLMGLMLQTDS